MGARKRVAPRPRGARPAGTGRVKLASYALPYVPGPWMRGPALSARALKARRTRAHVEDAELVNECLHIDLLPHLYVWAAANMTEWRRRGPERPFQLALLHIDRCGCGSRLPRNRECAVARAIVIVSVAAFAVSTGPDDALLPRIAERVAGDIERIIKRRLLPYHPSRLENEHVEQLRRLQHEPVASEIRKLGRAYQQLLLLCEGVRAFAASTADRFRRRALSPQALRSSKKHRPALGSAEAALRCGGFSDEDIARMLLDTLPGQTSTPTGRVATRSRTLREIPKVMRRKKMRPRLILINEDE